MIMVQSTFQLHADKKHEALSLMKNMVRLCRQENGCLSYEYFEGVTDPNQVVLLQEWESAHCLEGHYQTKHMEDFLSKLGDYLQSPVTTRSYVSQEEREARQQQSDQPAKSKRVIH